MNQTAEQIWALYSSSWKCTDAAERQAIFAQSLAPDCRYTDPLAQTTGWDGLAGYMAAFHEQVPGGHFEITHFQAHNQRSIAKWNLVDGSGAVLSDGISYGEYAEDGKLVSMNGFFEVPGQ